MTADRAALQNIGQDAKPSEETTRAKLVERVEFAVTVAYLNHRNVTHKEMMGAIATAAIDLIRAEVLEEAAQVVRGMPSPSSGWMADELLRALGGFENPVPAAIRALKDKT